MELASNLQLAEKALEEAQAAKPEASELQAIRQFCALEVTRKKQAEAAAAAVKATRAEMKALRETLSKYLQEQRVTCAAVSKADAKRIEASAAADGLPPMPMFVRLVQANKDSNITPEVVQEAVETITPEAIQEAAQPGDSPQTVLRSVVLKNVRLLIRGYSESLKLMPNLQRGTTLYDVHEVPPGVADQMLRIWTLEQELKSATEARKPDPSITESLRAHKERIEAFFARTGLTAQRIVVEGQPYRLVRRLSVRKPKIGIGKFEVMLDEILKDVRAQSFRPSDLSKALQIELASVPPETKSVVNLCAVKPKNSD